MSFSPQLDGGLELLPLIIWWYREAASSGMSKVKMLSLSRRTIKIDIVSLNDLFFIRSYSRCMNVSSMNWSNKITFIFSLICFYLNRSRMFSFIRPTMTFLRTSNWWSLLSFINCSCLSGLKQVKILLKSDIPISSISFRDNSLRLYSLSVQN